MGVYTAFPVLGMVDVEALDMDRKEEIVVKELDRQGRPKLWNANYLKAWSINFLINFSFVLIVPLLPVYLNETYGADKHIIGICLAGYNVMEILIRPFSGFMVDSFPRKTVLMVCSIVFAAVFGGYVLAGTLLAFAIVRTVHGLPYGAFTVSVNTVAIDVLPSERRGEGIGYYGLSNNIATAIGPAIAIFILQACNNNFQVLFWLSIVTSALTVWLASSMKLEKRAVVQQKRVVSLDRFFLLKGWPEAVGCLLLAFAHGIITTYVAIYGKEELGIVTGTGLFFTLFAVGLIVSRLTGAHALRDNKVSRNAAMGLLVSLCGYFIFAAFHNPVGYYATAFIIGLGNGHMWPAFQTMFVNLAEHNQRGTANSSILTAWDGGVALGVCFGGIVSEYFGYHSTFWMAFALEFLGVAYYFARIRRHFEANKLR